VRRPLPELIELIWTRRIDPGKVFDLTLPLEQAAQGYQAMTNAAPSRPYCGHRWQISRWSPAVDGK
jgi:threonine dehydrogenase-like Zn-dependent dehydrogenase